jgi:hypothetical protein
MMVREATGQHVSAHRSQLLGDYDMWIDLFQDTREIGRVATIVEEIHGHQPKPGIHQPARYGVPAATNR